MENNTQLPVEVVKEIKKDAEAAYVALYDKVLSLGDGFALPKFNMITDPIEKVITAYAAKLHQLQYEVDYLKDYIKSHPGAVWVKASERLPEQKSEVVFRKKGVSRTAKPFYVNEYLFNLIVEGVLLIEYYIGCPLSEIEWLDEAAAEREDAVAFAKWATSNHWRWIEGLQVWKNPMNDIDQMHTAQLYELFKQQKEK